VGDDVPVDSDALLVTDFVNLNIKSAQSFGCAHKGRVYVRMFIGVSAHTCMSIYVCTVFLKKPNLELSARDQIMNLLQEGHTRFANSTVLNQTRQIYNIFFLRGKKIKT
jgi:hypothetical protein